MDRDVLVSVKGIDRVYETKGETVYALAGVDLDIYRGEYLSIMGASGSGKSTLFNMIGALDTPTRGEVRVSDVAIASITSLERSYFRCQHIGYVFQSYNLIPFLTALENVALPQTFLGIDDDVAQARAAEVLTYVGLADRMTHRPDELSGGQQQRVAIARALANEPAILLADEPTGNLDLNTGEEIIALFKKLSTEKGVTVISATHDHKMLAVSDRIVWIADGKIERIENVADMDIQVGGIGGKQDG
ncbi:MAG: putative ABC transport system ATP-binding protein [Kiritimatiellia bacterium]|jgi:putative ABC transport system ATP-binding protein